MADFLATRINCEAKGELLFVGENREFQLLDMIEKRIFDIEKNKKDSENMAKMSVDKELMFLKNILKRLSK